MDQAEFEQRMRRNNLAMDAALFLSWLQMGGFWVYERHVGVPPRSLTADEVIALRNGYVEWRKAAELPAGYVEPARLA